MFACADIMETEQGGHKANDSTRPARESAQNDIMLPKQTHSSIMSDQPRIAYTSKQRRL